MCYRSHTTHTLPLARALLQPHTHTHTRALPHTHTHRRLPERLPRVQVRVQQIVVNDNEFGPECLLWRLHRAAALAARARGQALRHAGRARAAGRATGRRGPGSRQQTFRGCYQGHGHGGKGKGEGQRVGGPQAGGQDAPGSGCAARVCAGAGARGCTRPAQGFVPWWCTCVSL